MTEFTRSDHISNILRYHSEEGRVFDRSNDTVVVTRALLRMSADEIDLLRRELQAERERCASIADAHEDDPLKPPREVALLIRSNETTAT